jgi:hypothetical protein
MLCNVCNLKYHLGSFRCPTKECLVCEELTIQFNKVVALSFVPHPKKDRPSPHVEIKTKKPKKKSTKKKHLTKKR